MQKEREDTDARGVLVSRILGSGTEPDPRFTFANERTFLAWIRTSLALTVGGIGVEAFTSDIFLPETRKTVAVSLLLMALVIAAGGLLVPARLPLCR